MALLKSSFAVSKSLMLKLPRPRRYQTSQTMSSSSSRVSITPIASWFCWSSKKSFAVATRNAKGGIASLGASAKREGECESGRGWQREWRMGIGEGGARRKGIKQNTTQRPSPTPPQHVPFHRSYDFLSISNPSSLLLWLILKLASACFPSQLSGHELSANWMYLSAFFSASS